MQFTEAINRLVESGFFGGRAIWHNGNEAETYADLLVLDDETQTVMTPDEAELLGAYDAHVANLVTIEAEKAQRGQVFDGLKAIDTLLAEVDADLVVLAGTPTNAQLKGALVNSVQRQRKILRALFYLVKNQG